MIQQCSIQIHLEMPVTVNKVTWAGLKNEFGSPLTAFASHCKQKLARTPAPGVQRVILHNVGKL